MNLFFFQNGVLWLTTHYIANPDKKREIFLSEETVKLILKELMEEYRV